VPRGDQPDAICGHPDPETPVADRVMSVASIVCDLDRMELKACAGPPCESPYRTFPAAAE
jgi:isopenicillin-N N-acyltransferase like protein